VQNLVLVNKRNRSAGYLVNESVGKWEHGRKVGEGEEKHATQVSDIVAGNSFEFGETYQARRKTEAMTTGSES